MTTQMRGIVNQCQLCGFDPCTFKDTGEVMCMTQSCHLVGKTFTADEWSAITKENWQSAANYRQALRPEYRSRGRR